MVRFINSLHLFYYFFRFFYFKVPMLTAASKILAKCSGIQNDFLLILALYFRVPMPTSVIWPTLQAVSTNANLSQNCFTKVSLSWFGILFQSSYANNYEHNPTNFASSQLCTAMLIISFQKNRQNAVSNKNWRWVKLVH